MSIGTDENVPASKESSTGLSVQQSSNNVVGTSLANKAAVPFDTSIEPLLKENPRRFVIFPVQYLDIWQMYKKVCICILMQFSPSISICLYTLRALYQVTFSMCYDVVFSQNRCKSAGTSFICDWGWGKRCPILICTQLVIPKFPSIFHLLALFFQFAIRLRVSSFPELVDEKQDLHLIFLHMFSYCLFVIRTITRPYQLL